MSKHPFNLAVRFLLELIILFALGHWAWQTLNGWIKYVWMIALPVTAAALWTIFRTPTDHGKGLVAVRGIIRLLLEMVLFVVAWYCLKDAGRQQWATWFLIISFIHYLLSYDRILLLIKK